MANIVEFREISKRFGGVAALSNVSFALNEGETLALIGENGSGKSTLMKILSGIYYKDAGDILMNGESVNIRNPIDAKHLGIGIVHQEISLVDEMTVAQNIFLGSEIAVKGFLNNREMTRRARAILQEFHMDVEASDKVESLSVAQKQLVEIAKATFFNVRVLILDEPTATLTNEEVAVLFREMKRLKKQGVTIIFISHRLNELIEICDRLVVLRDGFLVGKADVEGLTHDKIVHLMVGRELKGLEGRAHKGDKEIIFEAEHLKNKYLKDVSVSLRKGEILGIAGLVGSRRTELARAIFGIDPLNSGTLKLHGKTVSIKSPMKAIKYGFGMVPEDRKGNGLILEQSIKDNTTLLVLNEFIHGIHVSKKKEREIANKYAHSLSIKLSGLNQKCSELSGGNQQKVVIGKWLAKRSPVIIFDEPTRGIDVGTKDEIYQLIRRLVNEEGITVIMISSEMREIVDLCSRVIVMYEGRIVGEYEGADGSVEDKARLQEKIGMCMIGGAYYG